MKKMDLKLFDSDDKYCWHGDWCRIVSFDLMFLRRV